MDNYLVIVIEHIQAMIHAITIFVLLLFSDINYFAVLSLALRQVDTKEVHGPARPNVTMTKATYTL